MNTLESALGYAESVRSGQIIVGEYAQLAVERHFRDLEKSNFDDFPYYFCEKSAGRAIKFFDFLFLTKGVSRESVPKSHIDEKGRIRFVLQPWQAFADACIFGWKSKVTHKRRFSESYIEISKKNGKTTYAAGVANYMLFADGEVGPEVYLAAFTRDQANICFDEASSQIKQSEYLSTRCNNLRYNVSTKKNRGRMTAVSHDGKNTEGKNAHCVILDEYHVHGSDDVKNSLQSGQAARSQPLTFIITTAGFDRDSVCYQYRTNLTSMLRGEIELESVFALIYSIDEDDDWKNPDTWVKGNPSHGITVNPDYLAKEFSKAKLGGTKEVDFKTKHLNIWVDAATTWIPHEVVKACAKPDFTPPAGAVCYAGLDLGSTNDLSALCLYFPEYNHFIRKIYTTKSARDQVKGGVSYRNWIDAGWMTVAGDQITDYNFIEEDVLEIASTYELMFASYDPYNAGQLVGRLNDILPQRYLFDKDKQKTEMLNTFQPLRQGFLTLSTPTKEYEAAFVTQSITHDGSPVLDWMLANTVIERDASGNMKPHKGRSGAGKIDGVVADIMAMASYNKFNEMVMKKGQVSVW